MSRISFGRATVALTPLVVLCVGADASADVWVAPFEWFPITRLVWDQNTLGSRRVVEMRQVEDTLTW